jgi:hypothetical protein
MPGIQGSQQRQALIKFGFVDDERRHELDHFAVRTRRLDEQAPLKRRCRYFSRQITILELQAIGQPSPTDRGRCAGNRITDGGESLLDLMALQDRVPLERVVCPICAQRGGGSDHRGVEAAEGTVVLPWLPDVKLSPDQGQRHRQAVAADRLGQAHDVRDDTCLLEAEERTRTTAAHLHVVDDEQHVVPLAQARQATQPLRARDVDTALPLHRFHDHRGGLAHSAARVGEHPFQPSQRLVEGHRDGVLQRNAGGPTVIAAAGDRQGAERHPMEGVGKGDDPGAPRHLARQFQRGFDRVGSARPGKLHPVVQLARPQDLFVEYGQEFALGAGVHVE